MKQKKQRIGKITIQDYIKAIKKADREIQIETSSGWVARTKVHANSNIYSRKRNDTKKYLEE